MLAKRPPASIALRNLLVAQLVVANAGALCAGVCVHTITKGSSVAVASFILGSIVELPFLAYVVLAFLGYWLRWSVTSSVALLVSSIVVAGVFSATYTYVAYVAARYSSMDDFVFYFFPIWGFILGGVIFGGIVGCAWVVRWPTARMQRLA